MEEKEKLGAALGGGGATNKISAESAEDQFDVLLANLGVNFDHIEIENGKDAAQTLRNGVIEALQKGMLSIEANPEKGFIVTQTIGVPTPNGISQIVYTDKIGKAQIAMGKVKGDRAVERMHQFMSTLSDVPVGEFQNLRAPDVATFNRLAVIFSMV